MTECVHCTKPVPDAGYLCHDCADTLGRKLAGLGGLARLGTDLDITITRQDRLTDGGGRSTETPLPYNHNASAAAAEIHATLATWAARITTARGITPPADHLARTLTDLARLATKTPSPAHALPLLTAITGLARRAVHAQAAARAHHPTITELALFLYGQIRWIRHQGRPVGGLPFAEAAYMEISYAAGRAARACDAHPSLTSLGPCMTTACDGTLKAAHGRTSTRCRECGQTYDVSKRMEQLLAIGEDYLFTVRELSSILSIWRRRRVPEGTIASWGSPSRGLMSDRGKIGNARVYRLGDATAIAKRLIPEPDQQREKMAA